LLVIWQELAFHVQNFMLLLRFSAAVSLYCVKTTGFHKTHQNWHQNGSFSQNTLWNRTEFSTWKLSW